MTNTTLLERYIAESGYKKSYLAKALGLKSTTALTSKVRNLTEFKAREIDVLCELLNMRDWETREAIFFAK